MLSYCSFCASAGINGPHSHFLRASRHPTAKIVCPKLLSTECAFCGKTGHTLKFCGARLEQELIKRQTEYDFNNFKLDAGEWRDVAAPKHKVFGEKKINTESARPKIGPRAHVSSKFARLDIDSDSSNDEDEVSPQVSTADWANVVKNGCRPCSLPLDLPPLVFGAGVTFSTRWSDDD
jgi:hypothetical protein